MLVTLNSLFDFLAEFTSSDGFDNFAYNHGSKRHGFENTSAYAGTLHSEYTIQAGMMFKLIYLQLIASTVELGATMFDIVREYLSQWRESVIIINELNAIIDQNLIPRYPNWFLPN